MGRVQVWVCPGRGKVDEATGYQVKVPSGRLDLGIWVARQRSGLRSCCRMVSPEAGQRTRGRGGGDGVLGPAGQRARGARLRSQGDSESQQGGAWEPVKAVSRGGSDRGVERCP